MTDPRNESFEAPVKPPRKRLGLLLMIPLILSMIVVCALALEWKETLKVSTVEVVGTRSLSKGNVLTLANIAAKVPLYRIDLSEIRQRIMKEPLIKDVGMNRGFPGLIKIEITEREPIATLNCGQMRYVDAEGVVLPYVDGNRKLDLPFIIGIDGLQSERVGHPILNKELFAALEIIQQAQTLDSSIYHMISELDMNHGGDIRILSVDAGIPVLVGRDDIPKKLLLFETFWTNFVNTGDAQRLKYIDLRFDDQVVVHWNEQPENQAKKAKI